MKASRNWKIEVKQNRNNLSIITGFITGKWLMSYLDENGFDLNDWARKVLLSIDLKLVKGIKSQSSYFHCGQWKYSLEVRHSEKNGKVNYVKLFATTNK